MRMAVAIILSYAMGVVTATLIYIGISERRRRQLHWQSPELWAFAVTGVTVVILLWTIFAIQWWMAIT